MEVNIRETANGYVVSVKGASHGDGEYVFRAIDDITMLEFVGKAVCNQTIKVTKP